MRPRSRLEYSDHNEKIKFARNTRRVIGWIAGALAAIFGFLQLKNIHISSVVTNSNPGILWNITLAAYYLSWVKGTLNDTDIQELAYTEFPTRDKWPVQAFMLVGVLFVAAVALCWAEGNIQRFAGLLLLFTIVDHAFWRYLIWFLRPAGAASEATYRKCSDYFGVEILKVVIQQVQGSWKWYRFAAGMLVILITCGFAYCDEVRSWFVRMVASVVQGLSEEDLVSVIGCGLVVIWVIIMEGWHWVVRLRTLTAINLLENLRSQYGLRPK